MTLAPIKPRIKVNIELIQGKMLQHPEMIPFHETWNFMPGALYKNKARVAKCKLYHFRYSSEMESFFQNILIARCERE